MKKRAFTLLLALVLVLAMFPVAPQVQAEEVPTMSTEVCPCCGKAWKDIKWTEYDKWDNSLGGWFGGGVDFSKAGHYRITDSFTMKKEFSVAANVTIDFNGLLLQAASGKRGFTVKNGGSLTLVNTGGDNGRLGGKNTSSEGGAIKVEAGGTLNILSGRVVGTSMSYNGGAIHNAGTVNIAGGKVDSGKANSKNGGNIYNAATGTLNLYGGEVDGGVAKNGGNIYNLGTVNLYGGTVTAGAVTGDDGYGGNMYISSTGILNVYEGNISAGTGEDHGGNIFMTAGKLNMYGGTISGGTANPGTKSDGTAYTSNGGNIYATKATAEIKLYGGTITGGTAEMGGNIALISGAQSYMYGGAVENGTATDGGNFYIAGNATLEDETKQYSKLYVLSGSITAAGEKDIQCSGYLEIYSCVYTGSVDITPYVMDCTCCIKENGKYTIWNAGYRDGTCTDCLYAQAAVEDLVTPVTGGHNYEHTGGTTYTCTGCGKVSEFENVAATVNGELFGTAAEAFAAANTGDKLVLLEDAALTEVVVNGYILDLNGFALTADVFTAATAGSVIDSSEKNTGKLNCPSVTLANNNGNLPVTYDESIRFCPVDFTQWIEPVDVDTTKVKFYFTQRDKETVIDDAILAGNTEIDVQIYLTWTSADGTAQEKTVSFGPELVKKYAEKWNGRVFVATITGTSGITDLQVGYRVSSTATSGVTLSANTIKAASYINDKLSWDKINSYPIKTSDMTVEEMRQLCVDFMEFTKTYLWTPDQTVDYIRNSAGTKDSMKQGTIYGGLPYVGVATGNPYRMMDYINPETGLLDMQKALPALGTKDRLEMSDLKYFGSQCSIAVYWAWGRVMNSTNYKWTSSATPYNGFVILGDVVIPDTVKNWGSTYGTDECVAENGDQVMFGGYAQLQKADGMVYYTSAGHLIMAYSDPVVVYNDDGTINGDESYIYIIDQAQTWKTGTNEAGDTYQYKSSVNAKKTFTQLFESNYIPFTFEEFLGTNPIETTEVSLVKGSTTYVKGTVAEADRSFQTTKTTKSLTWSNLMASNVTSNYGVVDVYIIIKDTLGNELYKHAVRTATAGNTNMPLEESGEMVTTWQTKALTSGKTYNAEIVVQLSTGERPTIWNGQLTMDN